LFAKLIINWEWCWIDGCGSFSTKDGDKRNRREIIFFNFLILDKMGWGFGFGFGRTKAGEEAGTEILSHMSETRVRCLS